ncbi:hypothetical protein VTO42DRAFT_1680 [Malbranchea cinnamomea]
MSKSDDTSGVNGLDDDAYIAQLLAKDARETSIRYSALGIYAAAPKRPSDRVPRPNTRFLKHILRETDAHNANLKRKEEQEARERMRRLRRGATREHSYDRYSERERESKRRRVESPSEKDRRRSRRTRDDERERLPPADHGESSESRQARERRDREKYETAERHSEHRSKASIRSSGYREDDQQREQDRYHRSRRRHRERDESSRRSRSTDSQDLSDIKRRHSRTRHRSRSPLRRKRKRRSRSRHRSRNRDDDQWKHQQSPRPHRRRSVTPAEADGYTTPPPLRSAPATQEDVRKASDTQTQSVPASESDDDPLDDLIGPLPPSASDNPPIRKRGRGAYRTNKSSIDAHFAAHYDPALDVHLDDDDDDLPPKSPRNSIRPVPGLTTGTDDIDNDWAMALEALRDRARWRRQGADRLREAGFDESVVNKFVNNRAFSGLTERGGDDRDIAEVRWAKKGEGREWDRGKVINEEGHVDIKAPW